MGFVDTVLNTSAFGKGEVFYYAILRTSGKGLSGLAGALARRSSPYYEPRRVPRLGEVCATPRGCAEFP